MKFDKTVLQVIPALDAGGAERATLEIAEAVVEAGGRALVATRGGRLAGEIERAGGEIFLMPVHSKNPLAIAANRGRLVKLIREEKVDIVHARSRAPAWSALWAARAAGVPFVATYHGAYAAKTPLKRLYNSAMARGDVVIANSEYTAAAIRKQFALDEARLRVIPRGVDLRIFDPDKVAGERIDALSRLWGVKPGAGALRLLLPARLTAWKGQDVAIEAVAGLASTMGGTGQAQDLQLVLPGDAQGRDDYRAALQRAIEMRGVRDMIHLVGHCADMPAAYAWADAVLAPSTRPEAFGRVAVEAGAMGRPVIAAAHGGAQETVIDGETGYLVAPGNAKALAGAIAALAGMGPEGRKAMGARARERVRRLYSLEAMRRATLEAYRSLGA
uniref:Glycosyltransferase n=1 Tax=uncultured bacterium UPO57 TaxID=1776980 RepID=A0A126SYK4_9BACT|nr:glycosyltransferase [uncultured bacterium UPO57]